MGASTKLPAQFGPPWNDNFSKNKYVLGKNDFFFSKDQTRLTKFSKPDFQFKNNAHYNVACVACKNPLRKTKN